MGVESFIPPAASARLSRIAETDQQRSQMLDRVAAGPIDTLEACEQLGVTRARVNQLLCRRRAGDPDPLTTIMIAKLDTPTRPQDLHQRGLRASSPCSRRSNTTGSCAASRGARSPPPTANGN